ncbi:unnamed protein product, partial [Meganyctiphanes norvegica]
MSYYTGYKVKLVKEKHKSERNLKDIYNLFQEKGQNAPVFVARDLIILPPVTLKNVDVSILLHNIKLLQTEVKVLKDSVELQRMTSQDLYDSTKSLDARVKHIESPDQSKVTPPVNVVHVETPNVNEPVNNVPPNNLNHQAPPFINEQHLRPLYSTVTNFS